MSAHAAQQQPELSIIQAEGPDALDTARTLFREYNDILDIDLSFQSFEEELRALPGVYAPPKGRLLLAYWQGEPVGCVALKPLPDDESGNSVAEMKRLFVRKGYGRKGIGKALLQAIIHEAKQAGYCCIRLDSLRRLEAAARLYNTLPMQEIPPYNHNPLDDVYYMELDLAKCD